MENSKLKLVDQVAIVTGGARGMGAAIAARLAQEGAQVVIGDINEAGANQLAKKLKSDGHSAVGLKIDVTQQTDVAAMVETTLQDFGAIHILVNSAGALRPTRIEAISKEEWDLVLDINLNGTFLCSQAVLPAMKENQFGRIINMASLAGRSVSNLGGAHYTASKAGVIGFTRALAKEMGTHGITANAICPGVVDSEMARANASTEQLEAVAASLPIPRLGTPEEVAQLVLFLIADAPYINGASIDINGGGLMI